MQGRKLFWTPKHLLLVPQVSCTCTRMIRCVRAFSTSSGTSHYDVLGVTPAATHSDIKSAYYRLSMLYHPDKCTDHAAAIKFRAIKEAYEVLGNIQLKKLYDKGLMTKQRATQPYQPEPKPTDPTLRFYKSHERRNVVPTMDGTTPIYDFDAWCANNHHLLMIIMSRNHYGTIFEKGKRDRASVQRKRVRSVQGDRIAAQEYWMYTVCVMLALMVGVALDNRKEYDIDKTKDKHKPAS